MECFAIERSARKALAKEQARQKLATAAMPPRMEAAMHLHANREQAEQKYREGYGTVAEGRRKGSLYMCQRGVLG